MTKQENIYLQFLTIRMDIRIMAREAPQGMIPKDVSLHRTLASGILLSLRTSFLRGSLSRSRQGRFTALLGQVEAGR
ncbi:hypothetical protein KC19_4G036400 [Ceratodon purpureus]|uniref:Uncharacterized protein n=1 Tax=Ceratodon purpureus TaxID=3225 RepID=A0A8T0I666_CERPU|nr:hypothetical protein KC19_4G036400 [Ceratodon purpureus]